MPTAAEMVEALEYLQGQHMTDAQLERLHHPSKNAETFAAALDYFRKGQALQERNAAYVARVLMVCQARRAAEFDALVEQARAEIPDFL